MSDTHTTGGVGFLGMLSILFIGLKLGGIINWSWWYVTMPLWGGIALLIPIAIMVLLFLLFCGRGRTKPIENDSAMKVFGGPKR